MCSRVRIDYNQINFRDNWYLEHVWSKEQEEDFTKWLTEYLFKNTQARKEIMSNSYKNKNTCKQTAKEFIWNYGWKEESFFYTPQDT